MALFEGKTPSERNKLIAAMALGALALASLSYMFFGSSSSPKPKGTKTAIKDQLPAQLSLPSPVSKPAVPTAQEVHDAAPPVPVVWPQPVRADEPEPRRNIFAYYVAPTPTPAPSKAQESPPPTPTPPLLLVSVSPSNVYARTGDFTLTVSGDKFTPLTHIFVGESELPTRFTGAQQLSATVPAALIASEGARQVSVRTHDGKLFSNTATLNVAAPPTPNYAFVGIIGTPRHNDTALLQDKNSKEVLNVQRGDVVGGRFRVNSISEREVWLVDTSLGIKHTLPFSGGSTGEANPRFPQPRYTPARPVNPDDDDTP